MRVVALVSGGKDSCHSIELCEKYGHQVVALANLYPGDDDVDEMDSYMYQTVAHQVVGLYAECTGLPLFRRRIRGTPRLCAVELSSPPTREGEWRECVIFWDFSPSPPCGGGDRESCWGRWSKVDSKA